jgi:hypothetical protein
VLNVIQKPAVNINTTVTINNKIHHVHSLQPPDTPTTTNALFALHQNLKTKVANASSLEPAVMVYIHKIENAAENAFAEQSILLKENLLLFQQNNERSIRVSTKAKLVGNAKVMKYEDLVKEQEALNEKVYYRILGRTEVQDALTSNFISYRVFHV